MNEIEILAYLNQPCRFKMKSGKEVFGVLTGSGTPGEVYFITAAEAEFSKGHPGSKVKINTGEIGVIEKLA